MTRPGVYLLCLTLAVFCAKAAFAQSSDTGATTDEATNQLAATAADAHLGRADPEPHPAPAAPFAVRPRSNEANPLWRISIELLHATRERPLFSVSRRPPPPPVAAAQPVVSAPLPPEPAALEKPQVTLVGVVHGASADVGLFYDDSGKPVRLRVGQSDHGWIVRSADVRAITLEKESRQVTLALPPRNAEITAAPPQSPTMAAMASGNPFTIPERKLPPGKGLNMDRP